MKHSADGHYLFDNERFRELSETFKFRPQTCSSFDLHLSCFIVALKYFFAISVIGEKKS